MFWCPRKKEMIPRGRLMSTALLMDECWLRDEKRRRQNRNFSSDSFHIRQLFFSVACKRWAANRNNWLRMNDLHLHRRLALLLRPFLVLPKLSQSCAHCSDYGNQWRWLDNWTVMNWSRRSEMFVDDSATPTCVRNYKVVTAAFLLFFMSDRLGKETENAKRSTEKLKLKKRKSKTTCGLSSTRGNKILRTAVWFVDEFWLSVWCFVMFSECQFISDFRKSFRKLIGFTLKLGFKINKRSHTITNWKILMISRTCNGKTLIF